jgi:hypothetical protein
MQDDNELKHTFLNRRDWGSYLSALQSAATYPKVLEAGKVEPRLGRTGCDPGVELVGRQHGTAR